MVAAGVQTTGNIATARRRPTLPQLFLQLEIDSFVEIYFLVSMLETNFTQNELLTYIQFNIF